MLQPNFCRIWVGEGTTDSSFWWGGGEPQTQNFSHVFRWCCTKIQFNSVCTAPPQNRSTEGRGVANYSEGRSQLPKEQLAGSCACVCPSAIPPLMGDGLPVSPPLRTRRDAGLPEAFPATSWRDRVRPTLGWRFSLKCAAGWSTSG